MTYVRESLPNVSPYERVRLYVQRARVPLVYGRPAGARVLAGVSCARVLIVVMHIPVSETILSWSNKEIKKGFSKTTLKVISAC